MIKLRLMVVFFVMPEVLAEMIHLVINMIVVLVWCLLENGLPPYTLDRRVRVLFVMLTLSSRLSLGLGTLWVLFGN